VVKKEEISKAQESLTEFFFVNFVLNFFSLKFVHCMKKYISK
jgi:hypothetical protein